ncbi:MAG: hypothetical protein CMJ23_12950 [Phycisphaerae bacterium]|nr:hypothetical protein [Phycisphaerae bacterium]
MVRSDEATSDPETAARSDAATSDPETVVRSDAATSDPATVVRSEEATSVLSGRAKAKNVAVESLPPPKQVFSLSEVQTAPLATGDQGPFL